METDIETLATDWWTELYLSTRWTLDETLLLSQVTVTPPDEGSTT